MRPDDRREESAAGPAAATAAAQSSDTTGNTFLAINFPDTQISIITGKLRKSHAICVAREDHIFGLNNETKYYSQQFKMNHN